MTLAPRYVDVADNHSQGLIFMPPYDLDNNAQVPVDQG